MAKLKPLNVALCSELLDSAEAVYKHLTNKRSQNKVIVNWLNGKVVSVSNFPRFISGSHETYPAIRRLFLHNGYRVKPPVAELWLYENLKHPLLEFPFRFDIEIHNDQMEWLKNNHWFIEKLKNKEHVNE